MRAAFPGGLRESVPKEVLFGALRLEVGVLEDRLYTMLERARPLPAHGALGPAHAPWPVQDCTGVVSLEDVLRALACAAAGETLRVTKRVRRANSEFLPPMPLPASVWEMHDDVTRSDTLRANFAFDLYDLDGNNSLAADEVTQLVVRTMAGNARAVHSTLRAIGVLRDGLTTKLRRPEFTLMVEKAPNFMYPAFALQEALVRNGGGAADALEAMRRMMGVPRRNSSVVDVLSGGGEVLKRLSDRIRTSFTAVRRRSSVTFNFGAEAAAPTPSPGPRAGPGRPARSALRGAREASRTPSPTRSSAATSSSPASAPPLSPELRDALLARAFRAARLGRTEEVEAAVLREGVPPDAAFEPHRATLLHVAAAHGHRALCRRLLALGAPPRARDALNRTAAEVALAYRHWAAAEALQAAGVPVSPQAAERAADEQRRWRAAQQQADALAYAQAAAQAQAPWPHQHHQQPQQQQQQPPGLFEPWQEQPQAMPQAVPMPPGRLDFGWDGADEADLSSDAAPPAAAPPWQAPQWDAAPPARGGWGDEAASGPANGQDGFSEWAARPGGTAARARAEAGVVAALSDDELAEETGGPAEHGYHSRRRKKP